VRKGRDADAIQIVLALDGCIAIRGQHDEWREAHGIIVRPDVIHAFDCNGAMGAMLFVDPESTEGVWLRASLAQEITSVPDAPDVRCPRARAGTTEPS
jgi:AraC family transcriptional regulator